MITAAVVMIVEGEADKTVFEEVLKHQSKEVKEGLEEGRICLISADGASKVAPMLRALVSDAANCVVDLDNDEEGRKASGDILAAGLCSPSDISLLQPISNTNDTELEDLFEPVLHLEALNRVAGLSITPSEFEDVRRQTGSRGNRMEKWSLVVQSILISHGKDWGYLRKPIKKAVAIELAGHAKTIAGLRLTVFRDVEKRLIKLVREESDANVRASRHLGLIGGFLLLHDPSALRTGSKPTLRAGFGFVEWTNRSPETLSFNQDTLGSGIQGY